MPNPKNYVHDNGVYDNVVYWTPEKGRPQQQPSKKNDIVVTLNNDLVAKE